MYKRWTALVCAFVLVCVMSACTERKTADFSNGSSIPTTLTAATTTTATSNDGVDETESDVPGSTPLFYKVTDADGDVVWLLGSIHIATEDMYPLPTSITRAYESSQALAVECDVVAFETDYNAIGAMMTSWLYKESGHIYDFIDAELYTQAKEVLQSIGQYSAIVDRYIPSTWSSFIDNYIVSDLGYDPQIGIDMHFLTRAKEENKPIMEIESVEFQNQMTVNFSPELQEYLLKSSVESFYDSQTPEEYAQMIEVWSAGDEARFEAFLATEDDSIETEEERALYEEYNDAMIVERNLAMTDFAEKCLTNGDEVFICVGAAHVVGEDAMADLLRERGYAVELVK